jgi:hypothetical protein
VNPVPKLEEEEVLYKLKISPDLLFKNTKFVKNLPMIDFQLGPP